MKVYAFEYHVQQEVIEWLIVLGYEAGETSLRRPSSACASRPLGCLACRRQRYKLVWPGMSACSLGTVTPTHSLQYKDLVGLLLYFENVQHSEIRRFGAGTAVRTAYCAGGN